MESISSSPTRSKKILMCFGLGTGPPTVAPNTSRSSGVSPLLTTQENVSVSRVKECLASVIEHVRHGPRSLREDSNGPG